MVMFFAWNRTALDPKSSSCLPMTGEDTGLGALASPLAGYLEKVQARAASLESCPWCTAKGFSFALRSYRVNLQESITLCTNPQCLFPLVTRSLEDVLANLEPAVGTKRKTFLALEEEEEEKLIEQPPKRMRSSEIDGHESQSVTDAPVGSGELELANGQHAAPEADCKKVNGTQRERMLSDKMEQDSPHNQDAVPEDSVSLVHADGPVPPACTESVEHSSEALQTVVDDVEFAPSPHRGDPSSPEKDFQKVKSPPEVLGRANGLDASQPQFKAEDVYSTKNSPPSTQLEKLLTTVDITMGKDTGGLTLESGNSSHIPLTELELVAPPNQLLWKNSDNLCWLDSLLAALVNCKSIGKCKPHDEPQQSSVWRLMKGYDNICAAVRDHYQTGRDGVVRVPKHVLHKANKDLQTLRMSVFKELQPKLHCKLGQRETPVFAMPLLLSADSWAEHLFKSTFHWEFKCSACRAASKEWVNKTLSTCTNLVPGWHPLHAVHKAPCSVCRSKNQSRTMTLVSVPPVFALHFVEGLPDEDVGVYSFDFNGKHYSVTTVIQYNQDLKHFVTWIRNADGSWLEYDDLKHPDCKTHKDLRVPAQELHVVFWEQEEGEESRACSPSSTFTEPFPSQSEKVPRLNVADSGAEELAASVSDRSLVAPHDNTEIVHALSTSVCSINMDTTATAERDTSIGADTLLDTFEGLSHDDIVTLTLVDITAESDAQPSSLQTLEVDVPSRSDAITSTSDSAGVDGPTRLSSSETESGGDLSGHPTCEPSVRRGRGCRRGRGRGTARRKTTALQEANKAAATKAAAGPPTAAPTQPPNGTSVLSVDPASQNITTHVDVFQQASAVSSTDAIPPSTNAPKVPPVVDPKSHWSHLLYKHPSNPFQRSHVNLTPRTVSQPRPAPPVHSTPVSVKRPQAPTAAFHLKVPLGMEEGDGHPLKAAEMYGGFGGRSSNAHTAPRPPPPVVPNHPTPAVTSVTSLHLLGAKKQLETSEKKHTSKLPPNLSSTDALRHKLLKKLKAKKKKLAKLNKLLGIEGGASLQPDSTDLCSPSTVSSSTYDGSAYDDILSDLLSPATTASNLSPDSTEFLEMLAHGKDGAERANCAAPVLQANCGSNQLDTENFLEKFLSQAEAQRPTDMETEALSALELFI